MTDNDTPVQGDTWTKTPASNSQATLCLGFSNHLKIIKYLQNIQIYLLKGKLKFSRERWTFWKSLWSMLVIGESDLYQQNINKGRGRAGRNIIKTNQANFFFFYLFFFLNTHSVELYFFPTDLWRVETQMGARPGSWWLSTTDFESLDLFSFSLSALTISKTFFQW